VTPGAAFSGAKLAILTRGRVLTLLRDEFVDIPYPGHWDLPGGGREGDETPQACVLRELREELSLRLRPGDLIWRREYTSSHAGALPSWFFAAELPWINPAGIYLGDEGQAWRLMPVPQFLSHPKAVPHLAERLQRYLETRDMGPASV